MNVLTNRCPPQHKKHQNLKDAKCEIFDPFFTPINPAWVGDLRTGEFFFFKTMADICYFVFFAHAECAQKNCLRMLSMR
jgi:hypothetical protein